MTVYYYYLATWADTYHLWRSTVKVKEMKIALTGQVPCETGCFSTLHFNDNSHCHCTSPVCAQAERLRSENLKICFVQIQF